jgi:HEPN domain-containing protein
MQIEFWILFPITASRFMARGRLILRRDGIGLMPLSYAYVSPLQSDLDVMEIPVTLNRITRPIRVSRDGTLIQITLQADVEPTDLEAVHETVLKKLVPTAYKYVNRFLDIVRLVTDDPQLARVGQGYPELMLVVMPSQNGIAPLVAIIHGPRPKPEEDADTDSRPVRQYIESAIGKDEVIELPVGERRLSPQEVERIIQLCSDESALPASDDLLISARYSFHHGAYRESLLNAHMAIEARVDSLIYGSLSEKGVQKKQAENFLSDTSFKSKVMICLPALCARTIDSQLLDRVLNLHGRRNEVAHLGAPVFHGEASRAISTAKRTLAALESQG